MARESQATITRVIDDRCVMARVQKEYRVREEWTESRTGHDSFLEYCVRQARKGKYLDVQLMFAGSRDPMLVVPQGFLEMHGYGTLAVIEGSALGSFAAFRSTAQPERWNRFEQALERAHPFLEAAPSVMVLEDGLLVTGRDNSQYFERFSQWCQRTNSNYQYERTSSVLRMLGHPQVLPYPQIRTLLNPLGRQNDAIIDELARRHQITPRRFIINSSDL